MAVQTRPAPRRRWFTTAAVAALVLVSATGCFTNKWGIRESYRGYITGGIAQGEITTREGATWLDGPGSGKGPFNYRTLDAVFDPSTTTGSVRLTGGVHTTGHPHLDGYLLDVAFWNPRLEIDGTTGTLYVDLEYRPFTSFSPAELPKLVAAPNTAFATVDLSAVDWTPSSSGTYTIVNAPTTGITAAMQMIGFDQFYGDPVILDPFSVAFNPTTTPPTLAAAPRIVVSRTAGVDAGDQLTIWGEGFDPEANIGTRPPLAGQLSGVYVTLGRFADVWQPSAGAPSTARPVTAQRWALPQSSLSILDPAGTNPAFARIGADGRFTTTTTLAAAAAPTGNYGIYVYAGGGSVNASHELSQAITLDPAI